MEVCYALYGSLPGIWNCSKGNGQPITKGRHRDLIFGLSFVSNRFESPAEPTQLVETFTDAQPLKWNMKLSLDLHGLFVISRKKKQTSWRLWRESCWLGDTWARQKENVVMKLLALWCLVCAERKWSHETSELLRITKKGLCICETCRNAHEIHFEICLHVTSKQFWIQLGGSSFFA